VVLPLEEQPLMPMMTVRVWSISEELSVILMDLEKSGGVIQKTPMS
jgi:hypothetical protein